MKRRLIGIAVVALLSACPSTPAQNGKACKNDTECDGARCVFVGGPLGHCEGGTTPAPKSGEGEGAPATGEGEGAPATGEGEGAPATGEGEGAPATGEGEGAPATGEGEGEGEVVVDTTPHFFPGAFVGGSASSSSAHFSLVGSVGSSRRP